MKFGSKAKNLSSMRKSLEKKNREGGLTFIGENPREIRFLDEPENWTGYFEAYSPSMRKGWPVPDDDAPEVDDARQSKRYAALALDIESDKVIVIKLPVSLVDLLTARAEKKGTLTDIDLEVYKSGEGLDTVYGWEPQGRTKRDLSKYEDDMPDVNEVLYGEYKAVWGDDDEDEEEEPPRRRRSSRVIEEDDEEEFEDDLEEDEEDEDLEDEDEEDEEEPLDDEEDYWTEEELSDLTISELRAMAKDEGIDIKGMKKADLVAAMLGEE